LSLSFRKKKENTPLTSQEEEILGNLSQLGIQDEETWKNICREIKRLRDLRIPIAHEAITKKKKISLPKLKAYWETLVDQQEVLLKHFNEIGVFDIDVKKDDLIDIWTILTALPKGLNIFDDSTW